MSLFAEYIKETRGREIVETSYGFATYVIDDAECYIEDIYIQPEMRKNGSATKLADHIKAKAQERGCKYLYGTVNCTINDPTTSLKAQLAYGFTIFKTVPDVIILRMELK